MMSSYNRVAGSSVERLAALSDGIFAVAMTLLVLEIHLPAAASVRSERELWAALLALGPQLLVYLMSFMTLGIFWVGQQTQLNYLARSDRDLTWIHLAFLFAVAIMPLSTDLLGRFVHFRIALVAYWLNLFVLGAVLFASWGCAGGHGLIRPETPPEVPTAICRRIVVAQTLYAFGALLCLVHTYWSILFIVAVQLHYAVDPWRSGRRSPAADPAV
jgi:uncharacterized membrane protein